MSEFRLPSPLPTHLLLLPPSPSPRLPSHLSCKPPAPVLHQLQLHPLWPLCSPSFTVLLSWHILISPLSSDFYTSCIHTRHFPPPHCLSALQEWFTEHRTDSWQSRNWKQEEPLLQGKVLLISHSPGLEHLLLLSRDNCLLSTRSCKMPQQHSLPVHPLIAIALQGWVPLGNKPPFQEVLCKYWVSILTELNISKLTFILYLPIALFYTHKYITRRKTHAWNAKVLCFSWTPAAASTVESRVESTAVEHTQHIQHTSPYRFPKKSIKPGLPLQ